MDLSLDRTRTLPARLHRADDTVRRPRLLEALSGTSELCGGGSLRCRSHTKHTADVVLDISADHAWTRHQPLDFADLLPLKGICNA